METLLNKKQVAELLNISVKTLDLWVSKGKGPKPLYLGRLVRFAQSEIASFIQNTMEGK